jgi:hypothetical protein
MLIFNKRFGLAWGSLRKALVQEIVTMERRNVNKNEMILLCDLPKDDPCENKLTWCIYRLCCLAVGWMPHVLLQDYCGELSTLSSQRRNLQHSAASSIAIMKFNIE